MAVSLARRRRAADDASPALAHVLLVGGTLGEWADLGEERWQRRVAELGEVAAGAGARWLTLRAYQDDGRAVDLHRWAHVARTTDGTCTVIVDPVADGRRRFTEAMRGLPPTLSVDAPVPAEAVTRALYAPADVEPDLVVVLGPSTRLPPSLVWELAYGELVFVDAAWDELGAEHLADAIAAYAHRQRRFGGLG